MNARIPLPALSVFLLSFFADIMRKAWVAACMGAASI